MVSNQTTMLSTAQRRTRCRRKEESMELCGALAFVPLCLLLTACDSGLIPSSTKALTRSRATELILKGTHPQTIYTWVQTGNILIYGDCDSEIWNLDGFDGLIFISRRQQNM